MELEDTLKVIIVDDVPKTLGMFAAFISSISGVKVVATAVTIGVALASIKMLNPDVVVLDINMPRFEQFGNGIDVLRWIKQNYSAIQVIMFTNHSEAGYQQIGQQMGVYAFLDKSGELASLHAALSRLVQEHRAARGLDP